MTKISVTLIALCGISMAAIGSNAYAAKGDPVAGKEKAALCEGCHGPGGNSEDATYPRLAGQYEKYIVKQVKDFQKGIRKNNDTMAGMAAMVASVQDAKDIGSYFESQKMAKKPLTKVNKDLVAKGEKIFREGKPQEGVYGCINCHGERGKGKSKNISQFPVNGGQHRDYLIKNLNDFKSGLRNNDPGGMMGDIAKKLTDDDIKAVSEYLSAQLP